MWAYLHHMEKGGMFCRDKQGWIRRGHRNLVEDFGLSLTETGRQLGVSSSAVARALNRRNIEVI